MHVRDLLHLSSKALLLNRGRTALTMLGIIIGIASVILMISVGQAAERYLLSQVASFGSDLVFVEAGRGDDTQGGPPNVNIKQTLTEKDYKKLQNLNWPKAVDAAVMVRDLVEYGGQEKHTSLMGVSYQEPIIDNTKMNVGQFFSLEDQNSRARTAVLGYKVADKLFGAENPIGRTIRIKRQPFRVIGVVAPAGNKFFTDMDDQVYAPFTTILDLYNKNRVNFLSVKTGDVSPREAKDLVRIALRESHNINNPEASLAKDDFRVASQEDAVKNAAVIGTILQILLGSIASISLVVAGVGIMNIMYVTVTERTREIGLRKALGARSRDVLRQFLSEAVMLTVVAGLFGILAGIAASWIAIQIILTYQVGWTFDIPWNGAWIGFFVSAAIGIIFGYFPARRAAMLSPIESLRYE